MDLYDNFYITMGRILSNINNIENEVSVITAEDLIKLAKFYNVSVDYILRLTNNVNYSKNIEKVHDKVAS